MIKNQVTSDPCTRITALIWGFRNFTSAKAREYLFWEIAYILWEKDCDEPILEKNSYSETIIHDLARHKYTAFGGCGSSGKSHVAAAWGVVKWLCAPEDTIILITTTTMKDADQRVWGSVIKLMDPLEGVAPFRNRPSLHDYVYQPPDKKMKVNRGVFLIAAEKKKTREAMGRIVGRKAPHIVLIADELGELSPAIMHAAVANLTKGGYKSFQATGLSNPDSRFDAFGDWSTPKVGWENVNTLLDKSWTTKFNGHYRRFDAYDSPHLHMQKSYLPTQGDIDEAEALLGSTSRAFMRMWRAVFFDGGDEDGVYSEAEITKSGAMSRGPSIQNVVGRVGGLDLGYTSGGDRTLFRPAELGYADDGRLHLNLLPVVPLQDDVESSQPRSYQVAHQLVDALIKYKIPLRHVHVDATGGGGPICDVIDEVAKERTDLPAGLRGRCVRVQFGGSPTLLRPNPNIKKNGKDLYKNRVTELWFVGKEFMRCKQLFGLDPDTAKELTTREYDQRKTGSGLKVQLESKLDYKTRTGESSPDLADTTMLAVDSARQNFSFFPVEPRKDSDPKMWRQAPKSLAQMDMAGQNASTWI